MDSRDPGREVAEVRETPQLSRGSGGLDQEGEFEENLFCGKMRTAEFLSLEWGEGESRPCLAEGNVGR